MNMDLSSCMEKIKHSYLPIRYQKKLYYDLKQIEKSEIPKLCKIILFGSCARNQLRVGSDIDLLLLAEENVTRELRGELSSDLAEPKDGVSTELVFYTINDCENSNSLLIKEIKKDGLVLWEE